MLRLLTMCVACLLVGCGDERDGEVTEYEPAVRRTIEPDPNAAPEGEDEDTLPVDDDALETDEGEAPDQPEPDADEEDGPAAPAPGFAPPADPPEEEPEDEPPPAEPAGPADELPEAEALYTANDRFVAAFCACYAGSLYGGSVQACVADQPGRADVAPNACDNEAMAAMPEEGAQFLSCMAGAIDDFRLCFTGCPPPGHADFDVCFRILDAGYTRCFVQTPEPLESQLVACQ